MWFRRMIRAVILLKNYFIGTTKDLDVVSVIHEIRRTILEANVPDGVATVTVPAPGGAVTIIEPLPDIVEKLKEALRIFPGEGVDTKNRRKEEVPVWPRIAAAMLGKSLQVPFAGGKLALGPREEVVLIDFEMTARRREFFVQIIGEAPPPGQPQRGAVPKKK